VRITLGSSTFDTRRASPSGATMLLAPREERPPPDLTKWRCGALLPLKARSGHGEAMLLSLSGRTLAMSSRQRLAFFAAAGYWRLMSLRPPAWRNGCGLTVGSLEATEAMSHA